MGHRERKRKIEVIVQVYNGNTSWILFYFFFLNKKKIETSFVGKIFLLSSYRGILIMSININNGTVRVKVIFVRVLRPLHHFK